MNVNVVTPLNIKHGRSRNLPCIVYYVVDIYATMNHVHQLVLDVQDQTDLCLKGGGGHIGQSNPKRRNNGFLLKPLNFFTIILKLCFHMSLNIICWKILKKLKYAIYLSSHSRPFSAQDFPSPPVKLPAVTHIPCLLAAWQHYFSWVAALKKIHVYTCNITVEFFRTGLLAYLSPPIV